jgi:hypothetical protein
MDAGSDAWRGGLRVLLSYNATDAWLAEALRASLFVLKPEIDIVLSPDPDAATSRRRSKPLDVREFDALLLVAGPSGLSATQEAEWSAAAQHATHGDDFVALPILAGNTKPPRHVAFHNRAWFRAPVVTDRDMVCNLIQLLMNRPS